jgi:hypothetical protein
MGATERDENVSSIHECKEWPVNRCPLLSEIGMAFFANVQFPRTLARGFKARWVRNANHRHSPESWLFPCASGILKWIFRAITYSNPGLMPSATCHVCEASCPFLREFGRPFIGHESGIGLGFFEFLSHGALDDGSKIVCGRVDHQIGPFHDHRRRKGET